MKYAIATILISCLFLFQCDFSLAEKCPTIQNSVNDIKPITIDSIVGYWQYKDNGEIVTIVIWHNLDCYLKDIYPTNPSFYKEIYGKITVITNGGGGNRIDIHPREIYETFIALDNTVDTLDSLYDGSTIYTMMYARINDNKLISYSLFDQYTECGTTFHDDRTYQRCDSTAIIPEMWQHIAKPKVN